MGSAAVFWDRDDTLIRDPGYLRDPEQVELLPGAAEAIRALAAAGYQNIIVTNQSGVARGLMDEATVDQVHDRLRTLLGRQGAAVDEIYYCPFLDGPDAVVEQYRRDSDLRKPKPGMLVKASLERNLDLAASWSIGDSLRDAEAGRAAGCRTVLIEGRQDEPLDGRHKAVDFVVGSLEEAVDVVLKHTRTSTGVSQQASASADASAAVLQEILSFMRMQDRKSRAEEFSLARLVGAIAQLLAIGGLIWAIFGLIGDDTYWMQITRLTYVVILQLIALTAFTLSGRR